MGVGTVRAEQGFSLDWGQTGTSGSLHGGHQRILVPYLENCYSILEPKVRQKAEMNEKQGRENQTRGWSDLHDSPPGRENSTSISFQFRTSS